jgi:hypothetical protein
MFRGFVAGVLATIVVALVGGYIVLRSGLIPTKADGRESDYWHRSVRTALCDLPRHRKRRGVDVADCERRISAAAATGHGWGLSLGAAELGQPIFWQTSTTGRVRRGEEVGFAMDSPLEQAGFELSVPPAGAGPAPSHQRTC